MVLRYVKDGDEAKDVAQRAFVRAFEGLAGFRADAAFRTWLYRIALNLALNHPPPRGARGPRARRGAPGARGGGGPNGGGGGGRGEKKSVSPPRGAPCG